MGTLQPIFSIESGWSSAPSVFGYNIILRCIAKKTLGTKFYKYNIQEKGGIEIKENLG